MVNEKASVAFDILLLALLFNPLKHTEDRLYPFNLLGVAWDPLLLDLHFMFKLVLLEDLSLDLASNIAFDLSSWFNLDQGLSCACLSCLQIGSCGSKLLLQFGDLFCQSCLLSLCISWVLVDLRTLHLEPCLLLLVEFRDFSGCTHVVCCLSLKKEQVLGLLQFFQFWLHLQDFALDFCLGLV